MHSGPRPPSTIPSILWDHQGPEELPYLRSLAAGVNRRLLEVERLGHNCTLSRKALDRLQRPALEKGQRAPGLRFESNSGPLTVVSGVRSSHVGSRSRDRFDAAGASGGTSPVLYTVAAP